MSIPRGEFRQQFGEATLKNRVTRYNVAAVVLIAIAAILFQVYVPRFIRYLSYLELPLLVTIYFSIMRRSPITGVLLGSGIGLGQDELSAKPLGMFGITKTLVGYFAASVSQRFDYENPVVRLVLTLFFFIFHHVFYWILSRALMGEALDFDIAQSLVVAILNSMVAVPLYHVLDKLRITV
jgi:rod shape-determining protein MreD